MPRTPSAAFERERQKTIRQYREANPNASWDEIGAAITANGGFSSERDVRANNDAWRRYRADSNPSDGHSSDAGYITPTTVTYGPRVDPKKGTYGGIPTPSGTSWWKPLAYANGGESEILASSANALIPSLGGDEQANIAKWLGNNFQDFSDYKTATIAPMSGDMSALRNQMFSKDRAKTAISALDAMRIAMGVGEDKMGSGYAFLKKTAALLDKYGGDGKSGMSRANFQAMQSEFEGMLNGVDSSYQEIGRALINPSAGGNPLMQSSTFGGRTTFGTANSKLFT